MLLTVLQIGAAQYALDASCIVEVLPLLRIEPVAQASPAIAGVCNYRGNATAVLDLNRLAGHAPAPRLLSTRMLLVRHGEAHFALLAAGVTETLKIEPSAFVPAPLERRQAPWLGALAPRGAAFIQQLEIEPLAREAGVLA
jgi:chemotaxis-related protein WspB